MYVAKFGSSIGIAWRPFGAESSGETIYTSVEHHACYNSTISKFGDVGEVTGCDSHNVNCECGVFKQQLKLKYTS